MIDRGVYAGDHTSLLQPSQARTGGVGTQTNGTAQFSLRRPAITHQMSQQQLIYFINRSRIGHLLSLPLGTEVPGRRFSAKRNAWRGKLLA